VVARIAAASCFGGNPGHGEARDPHEAVAGALEALVREPVAEREDSFCREIARRGLVEDRPDFSDVLLCVW
jgi:hypothetical protein